MEEDSFSRLGKDIISVVQLAAEGQWSKAEELHERVTTQVTCRLEEGHENLRPTQRKKLRQSRQRLEHLLASVLTVEGRWRQAETLLRELLQLARRRLTQVASEAEVIDMVNSSTQLATLLQRKGQLQEAQKLHEDASQISCSRFGKDHPHTLRSMNNLANVLQEQGKWQEAEEVHTEVPEARRRVLGQDHQDTLSSMNNLATVFQKQGKWQEAEEMHTEVLEARRRVLGQDHQDTLGSMSNLAQFVSARDREDWQFRFSLKDDSHRSRLEDAKEKVRKAIDALKLRVDADHPDLVERRMLLANLLVQTNEPSSLQEAVELLRQVVPASSGRYGPEHPWTQEATMNLVFVLEELGKTKETEEWQQRIVQLENEAETMAQDLLRQFVLISCHGHRLELLQLAMKVIALLAIKGVTVISFLVDVLYRTQRKWQCLARVDEDAAEGPDDLAWVQDVLQHKQQMIWARYRAVGSSNRSASQACSAQANGESSDAPVASSAAAASQVSNRSCLCPPSCESTDGASSDSWAEWKAAHQEMARTRTQAS